MEENNYVYTGFKDYFARRKGSAKVFLIISWILKTSFIGLLFLGFYRGDNILIVKSIFATIVVLIPFLLEKKTGIPTPAFLDLIITLALLLHERGMAFSLYDKFEYYDMVLHSFTSIVLSTLLIVFFYLIEKNSPNLKMGKGFIVLLGIVFTMAFGVVWEIAEFTLDYFFGYNTQPSLTDTMQDLILDTVAALIMATLSYISMRTGSYDRELAETDRGIKRFIKSENSD